MHIGGVLVFEPRPDGTMPTFEEVCERLRPRVDRLPHFRDRLSAPAVGGVSWPNWERDDRFELRRHLRRARLPAPGGHEELRNWAGEFYSERLDRARPLWEMAVIEGLEQGRWAIATKTHHALVDGVGSIDTAYVLLDTEREPPDGQLPVDEDGRQHADSDRDGGRSRASDLLRAGARLAIAPARLASRAVDVATSPAKARRVMSRVSAAAELIVHDEIIAAPTTSLNTPIGAKRALAIAEADLGEVKEIKSSLGGTVNDVVLAAMAGGLRRLLIARGELPPASGLRAMVPVNLRQVSERLKLGNKITSLFVRLPVAIGDISARYAAQRDEARRLKSSDQALGSQTIVDLTSLAPPIVHSFLARSLFATRLFNLTITNIPGPQAPLYALGAELREVWPLVPLAAEHALGLAVVSYNGRLFFCVNADCDSVPDLEILREGIENEIAELSSLARGRAPERRRGRRASRPREPARR